MKAIRDDEVGHDSDIPDRLRRHWGRGGGRERLTSEGDKLQHRPHRAAQYLRMSTDHQRYSIANQRAFIEKFAADRELDIIQTYEDAGLSGVTVDRRRGLQALLADVLSGKAPYSVILVYDVSRWGRFQDADEAAHYEYLCREAGMEIIYCAEPFANDSFGSVMKQLKRVMAGEYSRDLSVKVRAGRRAKAARGRALGGWPPYGFRRQVINRDGSAGPILQDGERKGRLDQEVQFVWGPPEERDVIQCIFDMYVAGARSQTEIAYYLNALNVPWRDGTPWTNCRVQRMLRCELVAGFRAYGKSIVELGQRTYYSDHSDWKYVRVLDPMIDIATYVAAQERMGALKRGRKKTAEEMVKELEALVRRQRPTLKAIASSGKMVGPTAYRDQFGSIREAYAQAGYHYSGFRRGLNADGTLMSPDQILDAIRDLYDTNGHISLTMIKGAGSKLPGDHRIRQIFGSIPNAYVAAGIPVRGSALRHLESRRGRMSDHKPIVRLPTPEVARNRPLIG